MTTQGTCKDCRFFRESKSILDIKHYDTALFSWLISLFNLEDEEIIKLFKINYCRSGMSPLLWGNSPDFGCNHHKPKEGEGEG